ncbi:CU044_5270 family protein [Micromonospora sp. NPDC049559]|uniref:CU044_5270 family protein n=1 Tax=Micromonospora sp. NPDC049559 TaxID=3155923 RepID=UPI00342F664A
MNVHHSRLEPRDGDPAERLFSRDEVELPEGRHLFHRKQLMAFIEAETAATPAAQPAAPRRRSFLRPAFVLPAVACSLALVAGAAVAVLSPDGGTQGTTGPALTTTLVEGDGKGVPQLLERISLAAVEGPASAEQVRAGQYIYIESKVGTTYEKTVDDKTTLVSDGIHTRRIWRSTDGTKGWLIDPAVTPPKGESIDAINEKGEVQQSFLNFPSYDYLKTLPTDPDALLKKIYTETKGHGNSPDQEAFTTIGDLLKESLLPAPLAAALYRAAAKIPGVVEVPRAEDAAGRTGVAVARLDETSGRRTEWIFDAKTFTYLGERNVQVRANGGDAGLITPGTVTFTSAILVREAVDQLPDGAR